MQVDTLNAESSCIEEVEIYIELYRDVVEYTKTSITYDSGRAEKGSGEGSTIGFYLSQATQYADMTVELTNLYNECSLDYYMQAWAPLFTSVSGFLNITVSLA